MTLGCFLGPVVSIALSSDLNCIIASTMGGVIRLFERQSGAELNMYIFKN